MNRNGDHGRESAYRGFVLGSERREVLHLAEKQGHKLVNG